MTALIDLVAAPGLGTAATLGLLALSMLASFITVAFGIGGGILMIGALAAVLPAAAVIPVHGVVQLGSNLGRAAILLRHATWKMVPWFVAGSLAGVTLGGRIVSDLAPWAIQIGVGCFVVWSVVGSLPRWFSRWPALAGALSSFLTMFFGATGPFVAAFTKSLGLDRQAHVATNAVLLITQHGLKVVAFGFLGFAFAPWAGFIAGLIATGFIGTLIGRQVLGRFSDAGFHRALNVLLLAIAARLLWTGGTQALAAYGF